MAEWIQLGQKIFRADNITVISDLEQGGVAVRTVAGSVHTVDDSSTHQILDMLALKAESSVDGGPRIIGIDEVLPGQEIAFMNAGGLRYASGVQEVTWDYGEKWRMHFRDGIVCQYQPDGYLILLRDVL